MNALYKFLSVLVFLLFYGCATPPLVENMSPDLPTDLRRIKSEIGVDNVKGGAENFTKRYEIFVTDDMHGPVFKQAIIRTLNRTNIFLSVSGLLSKKYILKPEIVFQDTNFARVGAGSYTYTLNAKYTILEKETNKSVYSNQFTTACVRTFSDSFGGPPRHRMAVECAVRDNLSRFVLDLNKRWSL